MQNSQNHILQLNAAPFASIANGSKTIEMRLFDEKRQKINVDDTITFLLRDNNEKKILVKVKALHRFSSFRELYSQFNKTLLGYAPNEIAKPEDMEFYYSQDDIKKYGVVGIEIEKI